MTDEPCTCDGRQGTVCHDIRNEPHLVGCPRWGLPLLTSCSFGFIKDPAQARPAPDDEAEGRPVGLHIAAEKRAALVNLLDDLIRDNNLTCDPHPDNPRCMCSTARALRVVAGEEEW